MHCEHRENLIRYENRGKSMTAVFGCRLHKTCTIQQCKACPDNTSKQKSQTSQKQKMPDASVIIPCHNWGRFLRSAIKSCFKQSHRPAEIVVVDDASTDNTPDVAREMGVRLIRVEHRNVHYARKAGFEATTSPVVCFLDADDMLPRNYLEEAVKRIKGRIAIIYSDFELFGAASGVRKLNFNPDTIEQQNTLHAGCITTREAVIISRAFELNVDPSSCEDWRFWRQVLKKGYRTAKNPVRYQYRKHKSDSLSIIRKDRSYYERADLKNETVNLVIPLSGRHFAWPLLSAWLDRQTYPKNRISLNLIDTSNDPAFTRKVKDWIARCEYPDVRHRRQVHGPNQIADKERRGDIATVREVQRIVSEIYNSILPELPGEYIWIVEDDIIPPLNAGEVLMKAMSDNVASVTGLYESRFHDGFICWGKDWVHLKEPPTKPTEIGGNGAGCLLLRKSVFMELGWHHLGKTGNFDQDFYERLQPTKYKVIAAPLVCDHLRKPAKPDAVDVVYTWVDGSDPSWMFKYEQATGNPPISRRHADDGELQTSLVLLDRLATGVRKVWVVHDDCQTPELPETDLDVEMVPHSAIIPGEFLPTFNSHTIGAFLHRIEGLTDQFIWLNDDVFLQQPEDLTTYFDGPVKFGQRERTVEDLIRIEMQEGRNDLYHIHGKKNAADLIATIDPGMFARDNDHRAIATHKDVCKLAWMLFDKELRASMTPVRATSNIQFHGHLVPHLGMIYGLVQGVADRDGIWTCHNNGMDERQKEQVLEAIEPTL